FVIILGRSLACYTFNVNDYGWACWTSSRFEIMPAGNVIRIGNMDHWLSQLELTLAALVNNDSCIEWLATYGLLCNSRMCKRCRGNIPCLLSRRDRLADRYIWRCPRCRADISIRLDSFFIGSNYNICTTNW